MELKPLNARAENQSFNVDNANVQKKELQQARFRDPNHIIPPAIYSIVASQMRSIILAIIFSSMMILSSVVLIIIFAISLKTGWFIYTPVCICFILFFYKWIIQIIEYTYLRRSIDRYREDLKYDLSSTPQFINDIYLKLFKRQVAHNWITFIILFYVGIFTLLVWWLQNQNWGFLKFGNWIHTGFVDPSLIVTLLAISLLIVTITYIYCAIQRKRQIYRINAYFGAQIIRPDEILKIKAELNRSWRRWFYISVFIILVVPLIARLVLKILKKG